MAHRIESVLQCSTCGILTSPGDGAREHRRATGHGDFTPATGLLCEWGSATADDEGCCSLCGECVTSPAADQVRRVAACDERGIVVESKDCRGSRETAEFVEWLTYHSAASERVRVYVPRGHEGYRWRLVGSFNL